jgi:cytochrome c5
MNKIIVTLSVILVVIGCATRKATKKVTEVKPTESAVLTKTAAELTVERALASLPEYTLDQFTEGKTLYEANCGKCHALKHPLSESEFAWKEIVPDMVVKANKRGSTLDANQESLILKYVVSLAKSKQ